MPATIRKHSSKGNTESFLQGPGSKVPAFAKARVLGAHVAPAWMKSPIAGLQNDCLGGGCRFQALFFGRQARWRSRTAWPMLFSADQRRILLDAILWWTKNVPVPPRNRIAG